MSKAEPNAAPPRRPRLKPGLDSVEFGRWYWTMAELQPFARALGLRAAGPKQALTERISAALAGRALPEEKQPRKSKRTRGAQRTGPLTRETLVPAGQRSSQALRAFFEAEVGSGFRFNGHMRALLLQGGVTLGQAVEHWYETVGNPLEGQSAS